MAALCPGVQYGLSSQENFCENKDLIFVKLTDSALRAIDEFLRNQSKLGYQSPKIRFLGNDGQISFPSMHNGGLTTFKFTMGSTADIEGAGSFECVHQTAPPRGSLNVLGSIPHKLRILANEDIYEATLQRMSQAEENHKNKCAREIKPNQTDIGRKVKVKQSRNAPPLNQQRKDNFLLRETLSKPSYPINNSMPSKPMVHNSNGLSNGLGSNHVSSSRPQQNKPSVRDIVKRPLKERLIHLLALKPYKKPELFERINREGLREKNAMTSILKQISKIKDNCYVLHPALWNEVHEDWPFYSESERMMLKESRNLHNQNLTPPGSDGSSGSGQSPTSTHPGSPPPPITSSKRPGYYDGADGLPTKRPRISHFRKTVEPNPRTPLENNSHRRPVIDSRDASNMNPRSRESPSNNYTSSNTNGYSMLNDRRNLSEDEDNADRNFACDSHSLLSFGVNREKTLANSRSSPMKIVDDARKEAFTERNEVRNGLSNGVVNGRTSNPEAKNRDRNKHNNHLNNNKVSSSTQNNRVAQVSPDSVSSDLMFVDSAPPPPPPIVKPPPQPEPQKEAQLPDYMTEYPRIESAEQRRRYKALFNADYAEYKELYKVIERVSKRFAELEESLKRETRGPRYKDIKKLIVKEYEENKNDLEYQKAKQKFDRLHDKLSHIKRLVSEYDQRTIKRQY